MEECISCTEGLKAARLSYLYDMKALAIKIWEFFRDNPRTTDKYKLPKPILRRIKGLRKECPLCELFFNQGAVDCTGCPLGYCGRDDSLHVLWGTAKHETDRVLYAGKILEAIEKWTPTIENP